MMNTQLSFGRFLFCALAFASAAFAHPLSATEIDHGLASAFDERLKPFYHGVASGDPLPSKVIIWTRVTPEEPASAVAVQWEVSRSSDFLEVERNGVVETTPERDFTVKVDVDGLSPDTTYYYRFKAFDRPSITGKTRTLPVGTTGQVRLAVVSCSDFQTGYFNAYADLAKTENLNAILHLGDYIYEYGPHRNMEPSDPRRHMPAHETISLDDYRTRYAQYRLDPDLRGVHQMHPFIAVWDDHESANNSSRSGAQNHSEDEGLWSERQLASQRAYFEWLPIREAAEFEIYRDFRFGDLVHLLMLDTRIVGRDPQIYDQDDPQVSSEDRQLLGQDQLAWLDRSLARGNSVWTVFGNQVIFSRRGFLRNDGSMGYSMDAWDGYPAERNRVHGLVEKHRVQNWMVLTGDTHSSWAFELVDERPTASPNEVVGVEFAAPSVSSSNRDERASIGVVTRMERQATDPFHSPNLKWVDFKNHGYVLIDFERTRSKASYIFVEHLDRRSDAAFVAEAFEVPVAAPALQKVR